MPDLVPPSSPGAVADRRLFVPAEVDDAGLSAAEFRLLCHLARHRADYSPRVEQMAKVCRMKPDTVRAVIQALEARRIISIIAPPGRARQYIIAPVSAWLSAAPDPANIVPLPKGGTPPPKREGLPLPPNGRGEAGDPSPERGVHPSPQTGGDPSPQTGPHKDTQSQDSQSEETNLTASFVGCAAHAAEGAKPETRKSAGRERPESVAIPVCLAAAEGFAASWTRYIGHRRAMKRPMTAHAAELILRDLAERSADAVACLDLSVASGWQGCRLSWLDRERNQGRASKSAPAVAGGRRRTDGTAYTWEQPPTDDEYRQGLADNPFARKP